jgi:hypothetical protein
VFWKSPRHSHGNVGKEIYGSGESVWMYLVFEGLGRLSGRELIAGEP